MNSQTTQFVYDGDGNLIKKISLDFNKTIHVEEYMKWVNPPVVQLRRQSWSVQLAERGILGLELCCASLKLTSSPYINRFLSPDTIVPGYANPQALNRYSYANNNPLYYTDPSGHMATVGDDGGCPKGCRQTLLYYKSNEILHKLGGKDDLEAMVQIIEYGATLFPNYDDLLPALTSIFNGVSTSGPGTLLDAAEMTTENGCAGVGREPRDCEGAEYYFSDVGFHSDFRDTHNQLFHLWGYIANTATPGDLTSGLVGLEEAVFANIFHEYVQSSLANAGIMTDKGWGTSWNDFVLSEAGMEIGILITNEAISPAELGEVIRERIGINGPGSGGVLQIYENQYGPLYGTLHD